MKRTGHPKREDGYTMIFNELLEALMCADIPKRARRLIDVQMRFSFGCGPKSFTSLTKGEFASLADLDWSDTHRALGWLLEKRIFERDETEIKRYRLNKYYSEWLVRVGLRDRPEYGDRLARMVKSHLSPSCEAPDQSGETPDKPSGKAVEPSGESPDQPGKTPDSPSGETPDQEVDAALASGKTPDELPGESPDRSGKTPYRKVETPEASGETPDPPSGESPDSHLAKRQIGCADSPLETDGYAPVKKRLKKRLERKEDISNSYANQGPDDPVADPAMCPIPDGHPFFAPLIDDHAFWRTLASAYPEQVIPAQIRKMTAWLMANPKRKHKDYKRFIQAWLAREERKENAHGKHRTDSEESPAPFSDIPPELIA